MNKSKFQVFIENSIATFLSILKVLLLSRPSKKIIIKNKKNDCIILGNGPSLNNLISNNQDFVNGRDCFAVNFFWKSPLFEKIKPKYYIIISRNYWMDVKNINSEGRSQTFAKLAELTTWDMTLFVPSFAKKNRKWEAILKENKNITIQYINVTPIEGFKWFANFAFSNNFGMPRPHNVLIPCIKKAIDLQYEKVYLFGADHSWFNEMSINNDNEVLINQKHFYDENYSKPQVMEEYCGKRNIAQVLFVFYNTFNSYYSLEKYASKKKVSILNATSDSFIDAFSRIIL